MSDSISQNQFENTTKPKMLVAISYTEQSFKLLDYAKNLSLTLGGEIQAVYVENNNKLTNRQRQQLDVNIAKSKELGIDFRIISNFNTAKGIVGFASKEGVTHILVGKPKVRNLLTYLRVGDFVNELIEYSANINIVILGDNQSQINKFAEKISGPSFSSSGVDYLITALVVILSAIGCYFLQEVAGYRVLSYVLLFVVSILAFFYGTGPVLLASTMSAIVWNYFFIPPHYTLHIDNTEDMFMFCMFFIIALLNGVLTSRIRSQETNIRKREERTHALYSLTKELSESADIDSVKFIAIAGIKKYFDINVSIYLTDEIDLNKPQVDMSMEEYKAMRTCFLNSERGGKYQVVFSEHEYSYFPMIGNRMKTGMLIAKLYKKFTYGEEQFWDAYLGQISAKFEREILRNIARKTAMLDESDKLYKTLFNSISHEFRIPVTTIMGATDTLLSEAYPVEVQKKLLSEVNIASVRLNQLIENLLNMSRLESGHLSLSVNWHDVHDLINKITETLKIELQPFAVEVDVKIDTQLVRFDFGLMEQALHNLLLNATQYTPQGSKIKVDVDAKDDNLIISISDSGPGFSESEINAVFNKFYRGKNSNTGGIGLGLSITKGIVEAHKGTISVKNGDVGGAVFKISIPIFSQDSSLL